MVRTKKVKFADVNALTVKADGSTDVKIVRLYGWNVNEIKREFKKAFEEVKDVEIAKLVGGVKIKEMIVTYDVGSFVRSAIKCRVLEEGEKAESDE